MTEVAAHYDSLDAVYRAVWGESLHHGLWETGLESLGEAMALHQQRVMKALELDGAPKRVVDIGCGYGVLSRLMRERWGGDVLGVTNSPVQYRRCVAGGGARFLCGDWLEVRNESRFDAAVAVEMSGHVADLVKFFQLTVERVNDGGLLVMTDFFQAAVRDEKRAAALLRDGRFAALRCVNEVVEAATHAGWNLIRNEDWTMEAAPTWGVMQRSMMSSAWRSAGVWRAAMNARSLADLRVWAIPRMIRAYRAGNLAYSLLVFRKAQ